MSINSKYPQELLEQIKKNLGGIPEKIGSVFLNTPRHLFADKFLKSNEEGEYDEIILTDENIEKHLPDLYIDRPILLARNSEGEVISTISQPTLVLLMLKKLDLKEGQKVLEIGTASGWNAAMMAKLVGEKGHVYSVEILSELVVRARLKIENQKITNISLFDGDGGVKTYQEKFDRIQFTVGSYDIPNIIHEQLKDNGLLLMVLKNRASFDCLILFKKKGNCLESIENSICGFVSMKGEYSMPELDRIKLEDLLIWKRLKDSKVIEEPFWWGSNYNSIKMLNLKTSGVTSFLAIVEPQFELFKADNDEPSFGLIDRENESIVIWKANQLVGYGNTKAFEKIKLAFDLYLKLGMPSATCFKLKVYPKDHEIKPEANQWLIKRKDSQFLWTLDLEK